MNKFRMTKAGISVNAGIERVGGDIDVYEELLEGFLEDKHYEQLMAAIKAGDAKEAFSAGHALKGISGNLSMTKLFDALNPIVEASRGGSIDVEEFLPDFEAAYKKVYDAIEDMVKNKK